MSSVLRSRLFRTLTLALAVVFGQTAHAAKPVREFTPGTAPLCLKLSSARPESRKDFGGAFKKFQRPSPKAADRSLFSVASFLPAGAANFEASQRSAVTRLTQGHTTISAPSRLVVLRV
jgi:hypothetical protein